TLSLMESVGQYVGVLGAYSGALRVARAASSRIFVIGLLHAGEPSAIEEPWVLGNAEGIRWIDEHRSIEAEDLQVPALTLIARPCAADVLRQLAKSKYFA